MDKIMNYNFFIQAQIDHNTDTVLEYEFLLRKKVRMGGIYRPILRNCR